MWYREDYRRFWNRCYPTFWPYLFLPMDNHQSSYMPSDPFQCKSKPAMSSDILASIK